MTNEEEASFVPGRPKTLLFLKESESGSIFSFLFAEGKGAAVDGNTADS
jgi:hypothetical protein